jgi:hypothetical protein
MSMDVYPKNWWPQTNLGFKPLELKLPCALRPWMGRYVMQLVNMVTWLVLGCFGRVGHSQHSCISDHQHLCPAFFAACNSWIQWSAQRLNSKNDLLPGSRKGPRKLELGRTASPLLHRNGMRLTDFGKSWVSRYIEWRIIGWFCQFWLPSWTSAAVSAALLMRPAVSNLAPLAITRASAAFQPAKSFNSCKFQDN